MVPIVERLSYLQEIETSKKLMVFKSLLYNDDFNIPETSEVSDIDNIYYAICVAIHSNNSKQFDDNYSKLSRRILDKDSPAPFIHDDFLIFILIIGVVKFSVNKEWLTNIIRLRTNNEITSTFSSLVEENYMNKSNLPEVLVVFLYMIESQMLSEVFFKDAYKTVSSNTKLFSGQNWFRVLISIRAYDLAIENIVSPAGSDIIYLKQFERKFLKRIKILSILLYNGLIICIFFLLHKLVHSEYFKDAINEYALIIGILGFGTIGNFLPVVRNFVNNRLLQSLGYKKLDNETK